MGGILRPHLADAPPAQNPRDAFDNTLSRRASSPPEALARLFWLVKAGGDQLDESIYDPLRGRRPVGSRRPLAEATPAPLRVRSPSSCLRIL